MTLTVYYLCVNILINDIILKNENKTLRRMKMKKSYAELMMNPVKLRIMGQVAQKGEIGAKELKEILSDVPLSR